MFGVAFALTLPPLAGADEGVHFLRAWHVSNGHTFAESGHRAGDPAPDLGAHVPSGLYRGLGDLLIDGQLSRTNARKVWSHVWDPAPTGRPVFVDFAAAAVYPPVPYVPSAIGIRIGRLLGVSPFFLVLLARLADLAAFVALLALAIRRLPSRTWVLAILALTPVVVFQAATVSADVVTTALALLVIADALALMARPVDDVPRGLLVETVLATLALALCKQPYFLAAALLLLPAWRHRRSIGVVDRQHAGARRRARARVDALGQRPLPRARLPAAVVRRPRRTTRTTTCSRRPSSRTCSTTRSRSSGAVGRTVTDHGVSIVHDVMVQIAFWHVPGLIAFLVAFGLIAAVVDRRRAPRGRPADARRSRSRSRP